MYSIQVQNSYISHSNPLSVDILHVFIVKHIEIPSLEAYSGKGDLIIHVRTFQTICSDFAHDYRLLTKLFI